MKAVKIETLDLRPAVVLKTGHITEIIVYEWPQTCRIRRLDADHYIRLMEDTGEVYEVEHTGNRADALRRVRTSIRHVRRIINANFSGDPRREAWVTVTYAENVRETERVYRDWKAAIRDLRKTWPDLQYIAVLEPQERGAWHIHALLKRGGGAELRGLTKKRLRDAWPHGQQVGVERVDCADNLGAYLSAYLSNAPEPGAEAKGKCYAKGARLHLYPPGCNFYRCSRGIQLPEPERCTATEAETVAASLGKPCYESVHDVMIRTPAGEDVVVQKVWIRQYNAKRQD